jgi:hypothetical protein
MCTTAGPANLNEALAMLESSAGFLADMDVADMPAAALAGCIQGMERAEGVLAVAQGRSLAAFDTKDGPQADGQRTLRTWLVNVLRVTRAQAGQYRALRALPREHEPLLAGLRAHAVSKSVAVQLAQWTRVIPAEFRTEAEEILIAAARAGADLRALAAICAEILTRTAPPDPDGNDPDLDRTLFLDTTFDGAGVIRGDLTPQCAAMVAAVLDALSAPEGGGDLRTRAQRYHDALAEAMKRLLSSDLLPQRAGQPVKALVHVSFAELCQLDADSRLQQAWAAEYGARWAAQRAAASVSPGDGGAWLEGAAARAVACDAMLIPVVTCDLDPGAMQDLIGLCVHYDRIRSHAPGSTDDGGRPDTPAGSGGDTTQDAEQAASVEDVLSMLEHQILATILRVVSGPGGVASFLRRTLLGKGLNGPSLPLDVGQTDDIPVHLRRLVALRDQHCQFPGGCDQPASACEPHHVVHREDGGHTSLVNLKDYCWWHHHVVLHQMGWKLTVHPDGTSQVTSPGGKIIRSHSPPPRPGWTARPARRW